MVIMTESFTDAPSSTSSHTGLFSTDTATSPWDLNSTQAVDYNDTSKATSLKAASTSHDQESHVAGTVVALTLILVAIAAVLVFGYLHLKRKRKLSALSSCWKPITRSKKSSISGSRRALAELDEMETTVRPKQPADNTDDMFTIEDLDDNADLQAGRQEYFYDEVFGQSQFEDETTNNAMRNLYNDHNTQEEMLNIDLESQGTQLNNFIQSSDNKHFD